MTHRFTRPLLLAGGIGIFGAVPAGAGFVEAYVAANGGCGLFREQLGLEIGGPQPFGRPPADWEPRDVIELEAVGLSCVAGPPPIMPGSPGARFKRAVADFRRSVDEARRLGHVADGEREMNERIAASQAQDRARQERDRAEAERSYASVNERRAEEERRAAAGPTFKQMLAETNRAAEEDRQRREQAAAEKLRQRAEAFQRQTEAVGQTRGTENGTGGGANSNPPAVAWADGAPCPAPVDPALRQAAAEAVTDFHRTSWYNSALERPELLPDAFKIHVGEKLRAVIEATGIEANPKEASLTLSSAGPDALKACFPGYRAIAARVEGFKAREVAAANAENERRERERWEPRFILRGAYVNYITATKCRAKREGYQAVYLSEPELEGARDAVKIVEAAVKRVEPGLDTAAVWNEANDAFKPVPMPTPAERPSLSTLAERATQNRRAAIDTSAGHSMNERALCRESFGELMQARQVLMPQANSAKKDF